MADTGNPTSAQTQDSEEEHKKSLKSSWRSSGPVAKLTAVFAGIAALSTAIYAVVAGCQLWVMSGQLAEMQRSRQQAKEDNAHAITAQQQIAQDSLTKSQESFNKSAKNTADIFRDEQRAWVGATTIANAVMKEGEFPGYSAVISNTGKTPALHMHTITTYKSRYAGQMIDFTYKLPPSSEPQVISDAALQPGATYYLNSIPGITGKATKREVECITSGRCWWWIYGKITYQDVSQREHHTRFCFIPTSDLKYTHPCSSYNDAD